MSVSAAPTALVRFAPEKDYAPFVYLASDGAIRGLSVDLLQAVARHGGLQYETLAAEPLSSILDKARAGQVDLVSSLKPTEERAAYLAFTRPYVSVPAIAVILARDEVMTPPGLQGRRVAVGKGYAVETYARHRYPQAVWVAMSDDAQALKRLVRGEVDVVIADLASVAYWSRVMGDPGFKSLGHVGFEYALSFAYRRDRPDIGAALEAGLQKLPAAEREDIVRRWLPVIASDLADAVDQKIRWGALALVLMALVLLVAVWITRKKAHERV